MNAEQPPPIAQPDRAPTWELVEHDFATYDSADGAPTAIGRLVLADMVERDVFGVAKYRVRHTSHNGRDHLVDAYQEQLDLVLYLRAWLEEHPPSDKDSASIRSARYEVRQRFGLGLEGLWSMRRVIELLATEAAP